MPIVKGTKYSKKIREALEAAYARADGYDVEEVADLIVLADANDPFGYIEAAIRMGGRASALGLNIYEIELGDIVYYFADDEGEIVAKLEALE